MGRDGEGRPRRPGSPGSALEDRKPRHQPRRQRRAAGRIRIDGSELLLEEAPVDRRCELHHWMIKVDDLVELARKRSLCPDCRRSFGRMKAPVVALKQPGNHGPHAGSICQKICPQRPKPGKYDYFAQPESYSRSGAWEFFTEN